MKRDCAIHTRLTFPCHNCSWTFVNCSCLRLGEDTDTRSLQEHELGRVDEFELSLTKSVGCRENIVFCKASKINKLCVIRQHALVEHRFPVSNGPGPPLHHVVQRQA